MENELLDDGLLMAKTPSVENVKELIKLKSDHSAMLEKIKTGRRAVWWMAGILVLGIIMDPALSSYDSVLLVINFVIVGVIIACGILTYKKPFYGFLISAILIILLQSLFFLGGTISDIIRGILPRVVIVYFILVGLFAANKLRKTKVGLKAHGVDNYGGV